MSDVTRLLQAIERGDSKASQELFPAVCEDKTIANGKFTIDETKAPKEIDVLDESGKKNDETKLGIYEVSGDTYKYCLAPAGKDRPTEFVSKAGTGHSLGVSKREK